MKRLKLNDTCNFVLLSGVVGKEWKESPLFWGRACNLESNYKLYIQIYFYYLMCVCVHRTKDNFRHLTFPGAILSVFQDWVSH